MKGSYILLVKLAEGERIAVGKRGDVYFPSGYYAYVGSALRGIESRIRRHLSRSKRLYWHIDYLLERASIIDVSTCEVEGRTECAIAQALGSQCDSIAGFGCSDCHCRSHLFLSKDKEQMKTAIKAALKLLTAPTAP